jgi:hypothetical protein
VTTKAALPSVEASATNEVPELPPRNGEWHPAVIEWWDSVWRSPMAAAWLDSDMRGGLFLLADLHQVRWESRSDGPLLVKVAAEIRSQEVRFGLSPIDRRRLQWEIAPGAENNLDRRPEGGRRARPQPPPADDPRKVLRIA